MESITGMKQESNINPNSRLWMGILLVATGAILLAVKMGVDVPRWLYSWEAFLIALGFILSLKHKFRNPGPFIMMFVGAAFLVDDYFGAYSFHAYVWPAAIILLGLFFILRPKRATGWKQWQTNQPDGQQEIVQSGFQPVYDDATISSEEVLDITAVFGGVKKKMISKTFRGGDITAFMGGVEIDLTGADLQGMAVLDVSAVFGGIKLIVPADWKVQNKATAVFGGVEDKRNMPASFSNKLLVIDGTAVFGGIELKSY